METIFTFIDKILPLLSTLLGAYITYYVTVSSKKNEIKVNAQTKARDDYWIPCSMAITNLQNKIAELAPKTNTYISFYGDNSCEAEVSELLKYLQADKRIYFYERTRNILGLLAENIQTYENMIDMDVQEIVKVFRKQYFTMLETFPIYQINNCQDCSISTKKSLTQDIKKALLDKKQMDWMGQVTTVHFFRGTSPYADFFSAEMTHSSYDFYYEIWYQIKEYGESKNSFGLYPEQELGLEVLDFEYKNIDKFTTTLNQEILNKNYQSEYTQIFETLSLLQEEILSNIDSATFL